MGRHRVNGAALAVGLGLFLFWAAALAFVGLYLPAAKAAEPTTNTPPPRSPDGGPMGAGQPAAAGPKAGDLVTYTPVLSPVCLVVSSTDTGPGGRPYVWAYDRAEPGRAYHLHVAELTRGCA